MTATAAVETRDLVKIFERGRRTIWQRVRREPDKRERFRAVDGIDLVVEPGEIFGLLSPNGAGKTTTMKMLATLLIPTSGTIRVLGVDPLERPRDVRARLGAMLSGERSLYWKLTGRENLEYFAALYQVPPSETKARIANVLSAVKLADRADDYVERYSTGMRQRLALARALLPNPPLVVLDEPTVGLDPQASRDLRDRVRELKAQGRTVLLTTHYMEEADQLCDRLAIIDHGRMLAIDTPEALKRSVGVDAMITVSADGDLERLATILREQITGVTRVEVVDDVIRLWCAQTSGMLPRIIDVAEAAGSEVHDLSATAPTLETVFINLTGKDLRE